MLKKENALLSNRVSKLQDELYGARLAAKYMDKEISGRFTISADFLKICVNFCWLFSS